MTKEERQNLLHKIDCEGFDYCFINYSSWAEIMDEKFHKLRNAYIDAANALEDYIGNFDD